MDAVDERQLIRKQEDELILTRFTDDDAWQLGASIRAVAAEPRLAIVIDVRRFDRPLFYAAMPGTTPDNVEWVRRKSNTVKRFHRSSYGVGLDLAAQGRTLVEKYSLQDADYASHGGSFPIHVAGAGVIGSVTVSGLPQKQDHNIVIRALCELMGNDATPYIIP